MLDDDDLPPTPSRARMPGVRASDVGLSEPAPGPGSEAGPTLTDADLRRRADDLRRREEGVRTREDALRAREENASRQRGEEAKQGDKKPDGQDGKQDGSDQKAKGETDEKGDDDETSGVKGLVRKHPIAVAIGAVAISLLLIAGGLYWWFEIHPFESTDDAFIDSREFAIAPKISGYISEVSVTDNQFVGAGSQILEIDDRDYRVALEQAQAQLAGSQATLVGLAAQIAGQEASVEEARAQVVQAQAQLQFAQQDAARYQELAQKGAGTVQQAQQSTQNLQVAQATLARAQATVTAQQKQITALIAQQTGGNANVLVSQAQLDQARLNLTYTTVTAAQAGTVVRLSAAKGAFAQAGQNLTMFVPAQIWVTANYKETQITDMRPGQPVDLRIDAYRSRTFRGHIDSVQPGSGTAFSLLPAENATGNYVKVVQRIPVKIVFDEIPGDVVLGPGMSVVPYARVR